MSMYTHTHTHTCTHTHTPDTNYTHSCTATQTQAKEFMHTSLQTTPLLPTNILISKTIINRDPSIHPMQTVENSSSSGQWLPWCEQWTWPCLAHWESRWCPPAEMCLSGPQCLTDPAHQHAHNSYMPSYTHSLTLPWALPFCWVIFHVLCKLICHFCPVLCNTFQYVCHSKVSFSVSPTMVLISRIFLAAIKHLSPMSPVVVAHCICCCCCCCCCC